MRKNLIKWEVDNGYLGKFVADKLCISESAWSRIKNGYREPSYDLLKKFQEIFEPEDIISLFAECD